MPGTEIEPIVDAELVDSPSNLLPAVTQPVDINDTLTPEAEEDLANGGRENTRSTYDTQWSVFAKWCADNGRRTTLPTTTRNLASYISYLRRRDSPPSSLRVAIAAVQARNARGGYPDTPDATEALKIYQDHRYAWAAAGRGQKSSAPIDLERIRQMLTACPIDTLVGQRNRAILLPGYYIRGRASELAQLRISDLEFVSADLVVAHKRISKNDKNSDGREYEIDDPACLEALKTWLVSLAALGQDAPHLPLLRSIDMWGNLGPLNKSGQGLTRQAVNNIVKNIAVQAKVDVAGDITAHGLRAGGPTDLGSLGYTAGEIKDITGDWSSLEMVERYRKVGLRRAGKRTDSGHRASALSMLRLKPVLDTTAGTDDEQSPSWEDDGSAGPT